MQIKRQARRMSAANLIEGTMNRPLVRRRREEDAKTAVNRSDRPVVLAAAKTIVDELLEPLERAIALERSHGVAVDENQNFAPESLIMEDRQSCLSGWTGQTRLSVLHHIEVRDRLRRAILEDFEIVACQAAHRFSRAIGHRHVDVDDGDFDLFDEWGLGEKRRRSDEQRKQRHGPTHRCPLLQKGRSCERPSKCSNGVFY